VEPEMTLYSDDACQSQDLPILPFRMDWTTRMYELPIMPPPV
jgi:hypothetical protein